jgi:Heterokaryon incompatibility protein (HET)
VYYDCRDIPMTDTGELKAGWALCGDSITLFFFFFFFFFFFLTLACPGSFLEERTKHPVAALSGKPLTHIYPEIEIGDGCRKERNTDSEACIELIRYWIAQCVNEHQLCHQRHPQFCLTRLILLDKQFDTIRLCEGEEIPFGVRYATLSHCWGRVADKIKVALTGEKLPACKQRLPSLRRMQTFIDAVEFKLGLKYIWIDSICITQDSIADWQKEATQMSEVYKNSYVNITAAAAKDDTGGLFTYRHPETMFPSRFEFVREIPPGLQQCENSQLVTLVANPARLVFVVNAICTMRAHGIAISRTHPRVDVPG